MVNNIVYSTDQTSFKKEISTSKERNINLNIYRETKSRGGKEVIVIKGFNEEKSYLKDLLTKLKKTCGCGGTIKDDLLEIQGNKIDLIVSLLKKEGFKPKLSGGFKK